MVQYLHFRILKIPLKVVKKSVSVHVQVQVQIEWVAAVPMNSMKSSRTRTTKSIKVCSCLIKRWLLHNKTIIFLPPTLWNVHPSPSGVPYTTSRSRSSAPGSSWLLCRNPIGSLLPQLGGKRNVQLVLQLLTPATWRSRIQLILGSDGDGGCRLPHPLGAKGWPKRWNDVKLSPCPASLMRNASDWDPM